MGMNPLKAFHTLPEAKAYLRSCIAQTVVIPALVPYIASQLEELNLLDDGDSGPSPRYPIQVANQIRGRNVPMLFPAGQGVRILRTSETWHLRLQVPD
jgi:hypothetical protein